MHGLRGRGIIHDILSADDDLAVALLAQRPRVLLLHPNRRLALFRLTGVIQHQDTMGRTLLDEQLHALFIECERIPGGVCQQVLQLVQRGCRYRLGDGFTVLARQVGQQAGDAAFHGSAAGRTPKRRGKWGQERRQFGQGVGENLWAT